MSGPLKIGAELRDLWEDVYHMQMGGGCGGECQCHESMLPLLAALDQAIDAMIEYDMGPNDEGIESESQMIAAEVIRAWRQVRERLDRERLDREPDGDGGTGVRPRRPERVDARAKEGK